MAEEIFSPLDKAYKDAIVNKTKADDFYNLFLRSDIFIPTYDIPSKPGARRSNQNDSFAPVIIETDGKHTLVLFDALERLQDYATREIGYIAMPGHAILESMPEGIYWALNHTTEYFKEFSPDEIRALKARVEADKPTTTTLKENTKVLVGVPAAIPEGLLAALSETLTRNREVLSAYLGQVHIVSEGETPHLALVVPTSGIDVSLKKAIVTDLAITMRGMCGEAGHIDILVDEPGTISETIIQEVEPFHQRN